MNKIDRRRTYILMCDTETANTLTDESGNLDTSNCLCYDIGWQVIDKHGNVYEKRSFVNSDIFYHEAELMKSAYYAHKIPLYLEAIQEGKAKVANTYQIRQQMLKDFKDYEIKIFCAHNSRFDYNALNTTERWTTKSKYRYFLPYGVEVWDTLKMARDVVGKMPTYIKFCEENEYLTKNGKPRFTAEILYRYITKDNDFIEEHRGLEDVEIETEILHYIFRQHKAMRKRLWEN
jgi:hypothetical protein